MSKPASLPTIFQHMTPEDIKQLFQDSPTAFLESFSDVLTDILAERNALAIETAILGRFFAAVEALDDEDQN